MIYCTHIFDGLEGWPTHLMYVAGGRLTIFDKTENIPELASGKRLMETVLGWLREGEQETLMETVLGWLRTGGMAPVNSCNSNVRRGARPMLSGSEDAMPTRASFFAPAA